MISTKKGKAESVPKKATNFDLLKEKQSRQRAQSALPFSPGNEENVASSCKGDPPINVSDEHTVSSSFNAVPDEGNSNNLCAGGTSSSDETNLPNSSMIVENEADDEELLLNMDEKSNSVDDFAVTKKRLIDAIETSLLSLGANNE